MAHKRPPKTSSPQPSSSSTSSDSPLETKERRHLPSQSNLAKSRLTQLSSQLLPSLADPSSSSSTTNPSSQIPTPPIPPSSRSRRGRPHSTASTLPADYSDILNTLTRLRTLASTPDTSNKGYIRQKAAGKLWVRERVHALLDEGSLREIGSVSGTVTWENASVKYEGNEDDKGRGEEVESFVPSNNVQGFGLLRGRKIVFTADDYSVRAGHADGSIWAKTTYIESLSLSLHLPIIKLVDGSSGGGSVTTIKTQGYSYVPPLNGYESIVGQLNGGIPNLGAVLGPAIGLGAARVVACHFSVMAGDVGSLFNAGPKVIEGATFEEGLSLSDLGGVGIHCQNGTIDNMAKNENDVFEQLRAVLSYLPNCGQSSLPPCIPCSDASSRTDASLRTAIPRRKERMYSIHKIIRKIVDVNSFFEIGGFWGMTIVVGLARFGGRPVGIVANNCEQGAGALDAAGSQKLTKHLKLCDVMNLPIVQFVDIPGYAIGTVAERAATMRHGVNLVLAYYTTTIPIFSVLLRRVYGVAGGAMLDNRDPRMRIAWPSGDWGSLPLAGGIEVGHSAELKKAAAEGGEGKAKQLYEELKREYTRLMNPVRTANAFGIEEIVDPAVTRPIVCQWVEHVYEELLPVRLMERAAGKIRPQFA